MKRIFFAAVLGLAALIGTSTANAQSYESYGYASPQARFYSGPVWNYPRYGWGGYGYHSSTLEQGVLTGLGDFYRGVGDYNVATSVAAYNWQVARVANLQANIAERHARAVMYANVKANLARKAEENKKKNEARAKYNAERPVERLTNNQLNRETGAVAWPTLLADSTFEAERAAVEHALNLKFQLNPVSVAESDEMLLNSVNDLQQKLENNKDSFRPSDYYSARSFLIRMKQEASQTAPVGRLAASI